MNSFIFSLAWILKYFRTVIIFLYAFEGGTSKYKMSGRKAVEQHEVRRYFQL